MTDVQTKLPDNRIYYLLAMSGSLFSFLKKYNEDPHRLDHWTNLNKKDMRFYKNVPNGYFHHKDLLISAIGIKGTTKPGAKTFKESLGIDDNDGIKVFVDSGGYSIASGAISRDDWTDKDAFDVSVKNGNIFPILDVPIIGNGDFDKCLKISKESAEYYNIHKPDNGEIILNVAQGRNQKEFQKWVDSISKVKLDGWAMGSSHKGNSKEVMKSLFFMLTSGVLDGAKAFHVFGVSSAEINIYLAAIKHAIRNQPELKLNFDITFDSSSPLRAAAFMQYFMHTKDTGFSTSQFTNTVDWSAIANHKFEEGLWCDCPVCSTVTDFGAMMNHKSSIEQVMWCSYHNLYALLSYIKKVNALVEMCYHVDGLHEHIFPPRIARNILTIYEAFSNLQQGESIIHHKFIGMDIDDDKSTLEEFFG